MTVQVDNWKQIQAAQLQKVARDIRRISGELSHDLSGLLRISQRMYPGEVSGPPGDHLTEVGGKWLMEINPVPRVLSDIADDLMNTANHWESEYQHQKQQAEDEQKKKEL